MDEESRRIAVAWPGMQYVCLPHQVLLSSASRLEHLRLGAAVVSRGMLEHGCRISSLPQPTACVDKRSGHSEHAEAWAQQHRVRGVSAHSVCWQAVSHAAEPLEVDPVALVQQLARGCRRVVLGGCLDARRHVHRAGPRLLLQRGGRDAPERWNFRDYPPCCRAERENYRCPGSLWQLCRGPEVPWFESVGGLHLLASSCCESCPCWSRRTPIQFLGVVHAGTGVFSELWAILSDAAGETGLAMWPWLSVLELESNLLISVLMLFWYSYMCHILGCARKRRVYYMVFFWTCLALAWAGFYLKVNIMRRSVQDMKQVEMDPVTSVSLMYYIINLILEVVCLFQVLKLQGALNRTGAYSSILKRVVVINLVSVIASSAMLCVHIDRRCRSSCRFTWMAGILGQWACSSSFGT
ncbi:unnamed protein product [Prorocentrum cordatum]|uniref:Uncharacterized protein n=1 Tax=Prorocentrum cordatum TaxID=2364126 RepID=A0ABN9PWU8_9DINO|nr:unnamed protein product [Polarella glacialis]